jgi:AraC-like DNA-binding protein
MALHGMQLSLRSYGEHRETHAHDFHQIVVPIAGMMDTQVGEVAGSLSPRTLVVIAPGAVHSFRAFGRNRFVVLDADWPVAGRGAVFRAVDGTLADLARYTAAELASGNPGAAVEFHLAGLLAEKLRRSGGAASRSDPVERALTVMTERHAERLTVEDLADAAGLGASQFHAVFRRETGRAPAAMLADIRLDRACAMLRNTKLPIAEIALAVGFSDQSALTRCLRRRRAITPDTVRRQGVGQGRHQSISID